MTFGEQLPGEPSDTTCEYLARDFTGAGAAQGKKMRKIVRFKLYIKAHGI